jgi:hypothetical protein
MRTSSLFLTLVAAMIVSGGALKWAAPANVIREAAMVCGNTGCYVPLTRPPQRPIRPLGQPAGQPLGQPMGQPLSHG